MPYHVSRYSRLRDIDASFNNSPWMWGAPHNGFSRLIRWMRSRISFEVRGRPGIPRQDFHFQNRRNLSVLLDDPSFVEPIRAALFEEDGVAHLVWNRRDK